jgi:hypothetical protein
MLFALMWPFMNLVRAETVALWLFDEQAGIYPGSVLNDAGPKGYLLVLGRGAEIVPGKFGQALRPVAPAPLAITYNGSREGDSGVAFGLRAPPTKPGRMQPPLMWDDAHFAALFTNGDAHLWRAPFANATDSRLNVGSQDWTIECWLRLEPDASGEGSIFEIGSGPRAENQLVTRFSVLPQENAFALACVSSVADETGVVTGRIEYANPEGPPGGVAFLRSASLALRGAPLPREIWFHVALVHDAATGELRLFVDGRQRAVAAVKIMALPHGDEAYVSIGRDGLWQRPLPGALDELRISDHAVYAGDFAPPASFSPLHDGARLSPAPMGGQVPQPRNDGGAEVQRGSRECPGSGP